MIQAGERHGVVCIRVLPWTDLLHVIGLDNTAATMVTGTKLLFAFAYTGRSVVGAAGGRSRGRPGVLEPISSLLRDAQAGKTGHVSLQLRAVGFDAAFPPATALGSRQGSVPRRLHSGLSGRCRQPRCDACGEIIGGELGLDPVARPRRYPQASYGDASSAPLLWEMLAGGRLLAAAKPRVYQMPRLLPAGDTCYSWI